MNYLDIALTFESLNMFGYSFYKILHLTLIEILSDFLVIF